MAVTFIPKMGRARAVQSGVTINTMRPERERRWTQGDGMGELQRVRGAHENKCMRMINRKNLVEKRERGTLDFQQELFIGITVNVKALKTDLWLRTQTLGEERRAEGFRCFQSHH